MNELVIFLPLLVPLCAAVCLLLTAKSIRFQRIGGVVGSILTLIASSYLLWQTDVHGVIVAQAGGWAAPLGITFAADRLGAVMVFISSLMGAAVAIYSLSEIGEDYIRKFFYPLFLFLLFGVNGAFLTGDLFNLYVWFEVMLISSFVLVSMGGKKNELEGGLKYVCLNLLASALFLAGAGILYGKLGTLNMADLSVKIATASEPTWIISGSMLLLVSFGLKAGVFPLFFWLPASYHTPPVAVSAIFAGLLTKVGVYALIRAYTLIFTPLFGEIQGILITISVLTMITGVLGAASHFEMRKILSFHIVSQIGSMTLGLAFMTPLALAAAIFYLIHHIIVKTNLFLVSGIVIRKKGSDDLARIGGLYKSAPWLAALFFIPAFSLGGIPPLSGFWAKLGIIQSGLDIGAYVSVAAALGVGILTLFSMTKIWAEAFWKKQPEHAPEGERESCGDGHIAWMVIPVTFLAICTVVIGLFGEPLFAFSERAAAQLADSSEYISAVLDAPETGGHE